MHLPLGLAVLLFLPLNGLARIIHSKRQYSSYAYYVLEHDPHSGASLDEALTALGLELVEQVGELRDHWLIRKQRPRFEARGEHQTDEVLETFKNLQLRASATHLRRDVSSLRHAGRVVASVKHLSRQVPRQRVKRDASRLRAPPPMKPAADNITSAAVAARLGIFDPGFKQQWHLVNEDFPVHMVNATPVWDMGITGEGVIAAMVDDGLDYNSSDLASNFYAEGSYDFNDHEPLPTPKLYDDHHGTRCAGQIAAVKNDFCGIGIAYNAKVAGIRILSGPISDVDEAAALNYGFNKTAIYSCSWGPPDDGRSMEGPSYLIQKAVVNGILNGRDGKGSVFVFASGNGAASGDQCNFDGYTNSIYSVTVGAIDYKGLHPYYSEACAANMVVTYSSGSGRNIFTTDVGKSKCSETHGGTSAAAPNAVGIFALALSVRPELTWRDIQHLCVHTAKLVNPKDPDWETTASGRLFSYKYGFGSLDAAAYVRAAKEWKLVKPQAWVPLEAVRLTGGTMTVNKSMSGGELITPGGVRSSITVTKQMLEKNNFDKLEHVTVKVWISHNRRGDVEVEIVSPKGVKSVLAGKRSFDQSRDGFPGWTFMTVKHWDEDPVGAWTIRVSDQDKKVHNGHFLGWNMVLWGSAADPAQAKTFNLADPNTAFPPPAISESPTAIHVVPSPTTTIKQHPKPTAHLPGDHDTAEGEADKPAFSSSAVSTQTATPGQSSPMVPTADEGWFPGMANLVSHQKWVFGAIGAVALFGVAVGVFFYWRRRAARQRRGGMYTSVNADDLPMSAMDRDGNFSAGVGRTKELYDAFGELSEDDDADEETGLRGGGRVTSPVALGFHSGFLEDDEPSPAGPTPLYRDEPEESHRLGGPEDRRRGGHIDDSAPGSPGSGSADGSWVDAR